MMCFSVFCQVNGHNSTASKDWSPTGGPDKMGLKEGTRPQGQWEGLEDVASTPAIGSLHLSFEFHKSNLKVRVWQITDLLLPPPQTSMIESIFVRGYLIPDPAKKSHRKTEDIPVDPMAKDVSSRKSKAMPQGGIQHIFTPSSFRFNTPLLYTCVTEDIVSQRSIQLEVCMTQKHTHKSFLMAMVHMPLRTAVRRPIREKYPLIPCMNYTIPNSMRVYSAKDVFVEGTSDVVPSVSRSNSVQSNPDSTHSSLDLSSTLRDIQLESFTSDTPVVRKVISVNILNSSDDDDNKSDSDGEDIDDGIGSSLDVKICSGRVSAASSVTVDGLDSHLVEHNDNNNEGNLEGVVIHRPGEADKETSVVDMEKVTQSLRPENRNNKKKIIPTTFVQKSSDDEEEDVNGVTPVEESTIITVEEPVKETVVDISQLSNDTVLDIDGMTDSGYDNESFQSESPVTEVKQQSSSKEKNKKKKKIIPFEINASNSTREDGEEEEKEERGNADIDGNECKDIEEEDEISSELNPTIMDNLSPKDKSSASVGGSRPETPVWDFYDFAGEDEKCSLPSPDSKTDHQKPLSSSSSSAAPSGAKTSTSTSTLQESLARLSRPQPVLDTCLVSGPVLPSVMTMDDFEMDEDS